MRGKVVGLINTGDGSDFYPGRSQTFRCAEKVFTLLCLFVKSVVSKSLG